MSKDAPYPIEIVPVSDIPRHAPRKSKYEWLYSRIHKLTPGGSMLRITVPTKGDAEVLRVVACVLNRTHVSNTLAQWRLPPNQYVTTRSEQTGRADERRVYVFLETRDSKKK